MSNELSDHPQTSSDSQNHPAKTDTAGHSLWQIEFSPREGMPDRIASLIVDAAISLGMPQIEKLQVQAARGFLIQGKLEEADVHRLIQTLLIDSVVENVRYEMLGPNARQVFTRSNELFYVLPKPGVTDPEAESALRSMRELGLTYLR